MPASHDSALRSRNNMHLSESVEMIPNLSTPLNEMGHKTAPADDAIEVDDLKDEKKNTAGTAAGEIKNAEEAYREGFTWAMEFLLRFYGDYLCTTDKTDDVDSRLRLGDDVRYLATGFLIPEESQMRRFPFGDGKNEESRMVIYVNPLDDIFDREERTATGT